MKNKKKLPEENHGLINILSEPLITSLINDKENYIAVKKDLTNLLKSMTAKILKERLEANIYRRLQYSSTNYLVNLLDELNAQDR
jgi:S-adenosylmethionine synthetase